MARVTALLLAAAACGLPAAPCAGDLHEEPVTLEGRETALRFTWEAVDLPGEGESDMGLFGLHFDVPVAEHLRVGLSGFGAATGERGGFFTGGIHGLGLLPLSDRLRLEAGFFLGAGGGGAAPQGGGLMLRSHAGLSLGLDGMGPAGSRLGLHFARVNFPNGDIESAHLALAVELPSPTLALPGPPDGRRPRLDPARHGTSRRDLRVTAHRYLTHGGSRDTDGQRLARAMSVVGIELRRWMTPSTFVQLEAGGAGAGGTAGYAELTLGGGAAAALDGGGRWSASVWGGVGGGGGGRVETGGGLLLRLRAGLEVALFDALSAGVDVGIVDAPGGAFRAWSLGLRLGLREHALGPARGAARPLERGGHGELSGWRVRVGNQRYRDASLEGAGPAAGGDRVDLFSLKLDRVISRRVYLTGQAIGAHSGGVGGYAAGLVGAGAESRAWHGLRLAGELTVGVAGGGGVDVGDGFVLQPMAGVTAELTPAFGLQLMGGRLVAPGGALDTTVFEAGLLYRFSLPQLP